MNNIILQHLFELLIEHYASLYDYQLTTLEIEIVKILIQEGYLGVIDHKIVRIK